MLAIVILAAMASSGYEVPTWAWVLTVPVAVFEFLDNEMVRAFWRGLTGS